MHLLSYTRMPEFPANVHTFVLQLNTYIHSYIIYAYIHVHHTFTSIQKNINKYIFTKENRTITKILRQKEYVENKNC